MVPPDEKSLNTLFQTLTDWEHQLKAAQMDIPPIWEEPSP